MDTRYIHIDIEELNDQIMRYKAKHQTSEEKIQLKLGLALTTFSYLRKHRRIQSKTLTKLLSIFTEDILLFEIYKGKNS